MTDGNDCPIPNVDYGVGRNGRYMGAFTTGEVCSQDLLALL